MQENALQEALSLWELLSLGETADRNKRLVELVGEAHCFLRAEQIWVMGSKEAIQFAPARSSCARQLALLEIANPGKNKETWLKILFGWAALDAELDRKLTAKCWIGRFSEGEGTAKRIFLRAAKLNEAPEEARCVMLYKNEVELVNELSRQELLVAKITEILGR